MSEHATYVRVTTFMPDDGRREDLISYLKQMAVAVRRQDGCFGTQICTADHEPGAVTVISRWRDQSAFAAFQDSDAGAGLKQVLQFLASPPATIHLRSLP